MLWTECVKLNEPIIILEDDICFTKDFSEKAINNIINSKFEYVRLKYTFDKKIKQINENFYITYKSVSGAQGYYLTPNAAKKFIKYAKLWFYPVDDYLDCFGLHGVKNIIYKPFLISDKYISASTILHQEYKIPIRKKVSREIIRGIISIRAFIFKLIKN